MPHFCDAYHFSASRALLQLYRQRRPELLHKKERGRGADLTAKPEAYGSSRVSEGVSGVLRTGVGVVGAGRAA